MVKTLQNCDNDEFKLIVEACKKLQLSPSPMRRRGRKRHEREILYALAYLTITNKWSIRQAEKWARNNFYLLKTLGWSYRNPPKKSGIHNAIKEIDTTTVVRISSMIRRISHCDKKLVWTKCRSTSHHVSRSMFHDDGTWTIDED